MKKFSKIGLYGMAAGLVAIVSGCASEKIVVDYVMPAKSIADVSKVNVAAIKVTANVSGNLATDQRQTEGLVKQLLSKRLYEEGFYQVTDDIWSDPAVSQQLCEQLGKDGRTIGYSGFTAGGQNRAKVLIDVKLDLKLDANLAKKKIPFTLKTVPYTVKPAQPGQAPTSSPNVKAIAVQNITQEVTVFETVADGTLEVRFHGVNGKPAPAKYAKKFSVKMPKSYSFDAACPSSLKALSAAIAPTIDALVADISPYKESRELKAIEGGDERVVYLLNAKAFKEVVAVVEELDQSGKAKPADLENLGIAQEAMGEFFEAKDTYGKAVAMNPQSQTAKDGLQRVEDALSGKKAVKESGAKKNKETQFSK